MVSAGEILRRWRRGRKLKLSEAATLFGISVTELCDYELGRRRPGLARAVRFHEVADVPPRLWLVEEE